MKCPSNPIRSFGFVSKYWEILKVIDSLYLLGEIQWKKKICAKNVVYISCALSSRFYVLNFLSAYSNFLGIQHSIFIIHSWDVDSWQHFHRYHIAIQLYSIFVAQYLESLINWKLLSLSLTHKIVFLTCDF